MRAPEQGQGTRAQEKDLSVPKVSWSPESDGVATDDERPGATIPDGKRILAAETSQSGGASLAISQERRPGHVGPTFDRAYTGRREVAAGIGDITHASPGTDHSEPATTGALRRRPHVDERRLTEVRENAISVPAPYRAEASYKWSHG
jgi:hypothetical protein